MIVLAFHREQHLSSKIMVHIRGNSISIQKVFNHKIMPEQSFERNKVNNLSFNVKVFTSPRGKGKRPRENLLIWLCFWLHWHRKLHICIPREGMFILCDELSLDLFIKVGAKFVLLFCSDFPGIGFWCVESCIWRVQRLHVCLWANRLREIAHYDGS